MMKKFKNWFMKIYHNEEKVKKKYHFFEKCLLFFAICLVVCSFIWEDKNFLFMSGALLCGLLFLFLVIILIGYHYFKKYCGIYIYLEEQDELTRQASDKKIPRKLKCSGLTGAGKDTFIAGVINNNIQNIKKRFNLKLESLTHILYMVDFELLHKVIAEREKEFDFQNTDNYQILFNKLLKEHGNFLYNRYSSINYNAEFMEEMFSFKSINELLELYIKIYYRVNFVENYVFSNQPFKEDVVKGIMAKIFSIDYLKTAHGVIEKTDPKTKKKTYYQEKVYFPLVYEGLIIFETEVDAIYNNMDPEIAKLVKSSGLRNTKAFDRHIFGEDLHHYSVGQNHSRVNKSLRELDHGYATVIEREETPGHLFKIGRIERKLKKCDRKILKYDKWIRCLGKLKLYFLSRHLKNKKFVKREKISNLTRQKKTYEQDGYISLLVTITRNETGTASEISLNDLMKSENYVVNFTTQFVFKMKKCRGVYNTHYLSLIKEFFKNKSSIKWNDVKCWNSDLKLTENLIKEMNVPIFNNLIGITEKEILERNYVKLEKKPEE